MNSMSMPGTAAIAAAFSKPALVSIITATKIASLVFGTTCLPVDHRPDAAERAPPLRRILGGGDDALAPAPRFPPSARSGRARRCPARCRSRNRNRPAVRTSGTALPRIMPIADSRVGRVHRPCCRSNTMASQPSLHHQLGDGRRAERRSTSRRRSRRRAAWSRTGFSMFVSALSGAFRPALHQRVGRQLLVEQLLGALDAGHRQVALVDAARSAPAPSPDPSRCARDRSCCRGSRRWRPAAPRHTCRWARRPAASSRSRGHG